MIKPMRAGWVSLGVAILMPIGYVALGQQNINHKSTGNHESHHENHANNHPASTATHPATAANPAQTQQHSASPTPTFNQGRRIERAGVRDEVRGFHEAHEGARLIREGERIGGKRGQELEQAGKAMERQGDHEIVRGARMVNAGANEVAKTAPVYPVVAQPIARRSEFVVDRRQLEYPKMDDRGAPIDAKPVSGHTPESASILQDPKWVNSLNQLEKSELGRNDYKWHYDGGMQYSHHMDNWGDHWFGFYKGGEFYYLRHHEGRYWWRDDEHNRWLYWHEGHWWNQDKNSKEPTLADSATGSSVTYGANSQTPGQTPTQGAQGTQYWPNVTNPQTNQTQSASGEQNSSDQSAPPADSSGSGAAAN